jgi:hypothetical protein
MKRSGVADLPLHGGRVPAWLATRMTTLGTAIADGFRIYDETIAVLRRSLDRAKLGQPDKADGMRRLDRFVRAVEERYTPAADVAEAIAHARAASHEYGGRTVFDDRPRRSPQLRLF